MAADAAKLCRLQTKLHGGPRSAPREFSQHLCSVARGALEAFSTTSGGAVIKALQNLAVVLNKLNHPELALGYAHAATRLDRSAQKAHYQAAVACLELGQPWAALYYAGHVRIRLYCMLVPTSWRCIRIRW